MASEHDAWRDQAAVYALGALTGAERDAFEAHLASCASCSADVYALSAVADALAHTAPQTDPPAALRVRVLASVAGDSHVASGSMVSGADRTSSARPKSDTRVFIPWLAAAASLAIAAYLGWDGAQLRGRMGALEARLQQAILRADASERQIADARHTAAEAESRVAVAESKVTVLAAPDLARIDLAGQPVAPLASARAYWSRSRGLVFTASNLPALPRGRVYQLWVLARQPSPPISAGLLKPDPTGRVDIVFFKTPPDLPRPVAMAVTIEPEGGVPAPTGDKYLVGAATAAN